MRVMKDSIAKALQAFREGRLVGMPTETVYGLAAPIDQPKLVEKIFHLKKRPFFDPLIVHVAHKSQAQALVKEWSSVADALAKQFWPGPLTLVLPKTDQISDKITSGLPTVGLRCPQHPVARELLEKCHAPLAAPSANVFTKTSPTCAADVRAAFDPADVFVLEGGVCDVGIESTIVEVLPHAVCILRPGQITRSQIAAVTEPLGAPLQDLKKQVQAPGQMREHYRPDKPLYSVIASSQEEAKIKLHSQKSLTWIFLPDDAVLAARELYAQFRKASQSQAEICVLMVNPKWLNDETWEAVINRIRKASSEWI